jgi:hypothetical protein
MVSAIPSVETFGDFIEPLPANGEYMHISFSPSSAPLKRRWENNGLSADFIADYFRTFYVGRQEESGSAADDLVVENLRDGVKYVANELLENAMKFQSRGVPFTARLFLSLYSERLIFSVTNGVDKSQADALKEFIRSLTDSDPHELYFEAMRSSAREENAKRSGLGLLSMMCDYSAKLGWKFATITPVQDDEPILTITTMVTLAT